MVAIDKNSRIKTAISNRLWIMISVWNIAHKRVEHRR